MTSRYYKRLLIAAALGVSVSLTSVAGAAQDNVSGKTVAAIKISGNSSVSVESILGTLKTKTGDKIEQEKIKQDVDSLYAQGNYFDIKVDFTETPEGIEVNYVLRENPILKEVKIKGNTKVTTQKINGLLTTKPGEVLNAKTLNENIRAIEDYYHEQGYILAKVSDVNMAADGVLTATISEGMLEGIVIKGNVKTKTYVVTRELKLKTGQPFNAKDAKRSMQKIYNLGYFEDVNMKLNPGREPNAVILEVTVVEQRTGVLSLGGGYSKADGMVGIIELGDNNFRGTGDKAKIHWEFGGKASDRNLEFSYTKPWLDAKQTSAGINIYNMTNEYTEYGEHATKVSTYDRRRKGGDLTFGRPANEFTTNFITFKNRTDTYVKHVAGIDRSTDAQYLKDNFGLTRSVTLMRVMDTRDNVFNATEGTRYSIATEFAGLGGEFSFKKHTLEGRRYYKVGRDHVIATRMTAGFSSGHLPESGKFAVGGSDTVRGLEDDEYRGTRMFAATAEYRFPVVKKLQGVVFIDSGNAWDGGGWFKGLKTSVGFGIRMTTPLGPIRLDYGKSKESGKFHFSFGGQF